jgi:hypothetical protein
MLSENKAQTRKILKFSTLGFVLLLLFAGSSLGLVWVHAAGPAIQHGPTLLSGSAKTAKEPAISTSSDGTYVYVAWTQGGGGIYFAVSSNGGSSFSAAKKISTSSGTTQFPVMITGDGYQSVSPSPGAVYVAWAQSISGTLQIFVASSTTNGGSWTVKQVSTGGGITPALAASGANVYVTWYQTTSCPATALNPAPTSGCIYVDSSSNNGGVWTTPVELNPSSKGEAQVVASGSYVYVGADGVWFSSLGVTTSNWDGSGTTPTGWTTPLQLYSHATVGSTTTFGREPWIAASGLDVYVTFNAIDLSTTSTYRIYGLTSNDGGVTWYSGASLSHKVTAFPPVFTTAAQQALFLMSGSVSNDWEPENVASGMNAFMTFHSLANQGVYMTSTTSGGSSWSAPVKVPSQASGTSAFAHIFSSDGTNVWVMWGQVKSGTVWNAYVSYSANSGGAWSTPLDISNNAAGVAAGNQDVSLFWLTAIGSTGYAAWTLTSGTTSQVWFASITG